MHLFLSPFLIPLLAAAFITAAQSQPVNPLSPATVLAHCNRTFSCGSITNASYPFTGGDRPSFCGPPEFTLTCRDNAVAEFTHNRITYRVLQLDQSTRTLVISRSDLYNNTCPSEFLNTTLDSSFFDYNLPQNEVLNLFYCCSRTNMTVSPANLFSCNSSDLNFTDAYQLFGPVRSDPIVSSISCRTSVNVPLVMEAANGLRELSLSLGEALMEGFTVNYSFPDERVCSDCGKNGGLCGYNRDLQQSICFCNNSNCETVGQDHSPDAVLAGGGGSNKTGLHIGLPVAGAVLAGIGVGWLIFYFRRKRKQQVASESLQTLGKEIKPPPLSKAHQAPPSRHFTKSIPPYPSSKPELVRGSSYFGAQVFNYFELEEATDNFDSSRELGDGGFGAVYYGVLSDGRVVAVKRLYENNFKRVEQFMNEVEILTRLRHPHLVMLYGCTSKRSRELLLVYEYVPNGTVGDHLHGKRAKSGLLSWPVRLNIAVQTADALAYLHKSGTIHRDVKTNNILLDNDFYVKVADFGLSRLFPNDVTHVSTAPQGTPGYVDPEYYKCYHLTEKSDVYSFGVVLIELISSLPAVDTSRNRHDINLASMAINKIQNHSLHEMVDSSLDFERNSNVRRMVTLVAELAFRCLQEDREMRPSMAEVLEGLREIQNEDLNGHKVEIVDILVDEEAAQLKDSMSPPSSGSFVADNLEVARPVNFSG